MTTRHPPSALAPPSRRRAPDRWHRRLASSALAVAAASAFAAPAAVPASAGPTVRAGAPDAIASYQKRFLAQYNKIKDPANGYFSPEGIPYHSVETLMVEAPDYGHETTSEAYSFWIWLEAQYGRATGDWAPLHAAWANMEKYLIPSDADQPTNAFYNAAKPATYAPEFPLPSGYPAPLDAGVPVGADPIAAELATAYGTHDIYGMHWLMDTDDWYGYGHCGDGTTHASFINTFQRGAQESVWETVAQPSCETFKWGRTGGTQGFLSLFTGDSSYSKQWRYTDAPDADGRAVEAIYWASTWAKAQGKGAQVADLVAKAAKMGDYLRYAMFDKYFKRIGNCVGPTTCPGGTGQANAQGLRDDQHYLMSWYYAWGGALDVSAGWAWRIGASHNHQGYQNPLAAWVLSTQADFKPLSATGSGDWGKSLGRQLEFYRWLQSSEGAIAGGATNSWGGAYGTPPAGTSTFYGMFYDEAPVYHDPPSNTWFGFQTWSMHRVAEYYFATGDARAKTVLDKWVAWARANTTLNDDGTFAIPNTLAWTGQPDTWNPATPGANAGLHVTVVDHTNDVGVAASFARTLTWYGVKAGDKKATSLAKQLLDRMWTKDQDALGVAVTEKRPDYLRFDDAYDAATGQGVYIPSGWTGTNAQGATLDAHTTFLSERPKYKQDPKWPVLQAYLAGGPAPDWTYHRMWAQADVAMAMNDYANLMGTGSTPAVVLGASALTVPEGGKATVGVSLSAKPADTVTVTVAKQAGGDADLTAKPATLTFTTANWNVAQDATLKDAEDADALDGTATFTFSATGYTSASLLATEQDNDKAPPPDCTIAFDTSNDWGNGANQTVAITNSGSAPIVNWTLTWTESADVTLTNSWNATVVATGRNLKATPASFNATIPVGGNASFGMSYSYATRPQPLNAVLAGHACAVTVK